MNTICGLRALGHTYLATDHMTTRGALRTEEVRKIVCLPHGWALAVAGGPRALQVVQEISPHLGHVIGEYSPTEFVPVSCRNDILRYIRNTLREEFQKEGFVHTVGEQAPRCPVELLIAAPNDLWVMRDDFSYSRVPDGEVGAVGLGEAVARGAAYALGPDPKTRDLSEPVTFLRTCVAAAAHVHPACGAEADVWSSVEGWL